MTFAVTAQYRCSPEDADAVRERLLAVRDQTRQLEPGNLAYVVHDIADAPGEFLLYEQYENRAAFDAHLETPYFIEHIAEFVRPRVLDRSVTFATVL